MPDLGATIEPTGPNPSLEGSTATEPGPLKKSLRPMGIFLASRLGVLLVVAGVANLLNQSIASSLAVWDSKWYLQIAQHGYVSKIPPGTGNPAQSDLGFFPLLPLFIRLVHVVTGLDFRPASFVAVFLLGLGASVAVWWMLHDLWGTRAADRGTALIFFSPGALVLSYVYSEAATILFVALCLLALRQKRWLLAGLAAGVASAADPVSCAVIVPCVVASVLAIRRERDFTSLLAPILAPVGIASFFIYLWVHTGSPFEWFRAQRAGWQSGTYFGSIPRALGHFFSQGFLDPNYAVKAISIFAVAGLLVVFFRARPPATWVSYVIAVLAFGVISPVIGVTPRLLLRGFPLLGAVGARLEGYWFELLLGFFALAMAGLTVLSGGPHWTP